MKDHLSTLKSIGILGGTFNPVHKGHIMLVEAAKRQYSDIEEFLIMPNNIPAYKESDEIIDTKHRINMLKLAFSSYPYAHISDMEIKRGGLTYTYDTLVEIKLYKPNIDIYFIIGADSMFSLEKWFKYQDILKMCTLLVATRECDSNKLNDFINEFKSSYPFAKIELLNTENIDISSSELRDSLKAGENYGYIPENVLEYIMKNKLYGLGG